MAAEDRTDRSKRGEFRFHMPQAIPSYLIAIAIGDLTFKPMSERTGVWTEPAMLDEAAREFEDTEKMVAATEKLYGPYRWGRFDVLVLPPSFPFGGMENPRLTFATPTIVAGDKSLVSLVAHELAHSWSGNLVTNATWTDFWLNEGFTTYLERRIVEAVYGKARADMEAMIGVRDLEEGRQTLDAGKDRTLLPDLAGRDPDDAYSTVPYEQGALFLVFLESRFGRDVFDAFLRRWFERHAFRSATTADFLSFLDEQLLRQKPGTVTDAEIQEWLHSETIPAFAVLPKSDAFARVDSARQAWLDGGSMQDLSTTAAAWTTQEWIHFVDGLPRTLDVARTAALDRQFKLTATRNAEVAHVWYRLAIATQYRPAFAAMERYMIRIGRRKLILPLYRDLAATAEGRKMAERIYKTARPGYHPLSQAAIDEVLSTAK
jgi:aminopeptidase N